MKVDLEAGQYYLVEDKSNNIYEIKVLRVTDTCYYIKFLKECTELWVKHQHVGTDCPSHWSMEKYAVLEKLDPSFYREKKLERITKTI